MNWFDLAGVALQAWGGVIVVAAVGYFGWRLFRRLRR